MERDRILHIHEVYKPYSGGGAIRISRLLENSKHTLPTVLCSFKGAENSPRRETINGVDVIRVKYFKSPVLLFFVVRLLLKYRYRNIHVHNSWVQLLVLPLALFSPLILELHSIKARRGLKSILHRAAINSARKYIVLSQSAKDYIKGNFGIDDTNIHVVLNGFIARELGLKSERVKSEKKLKLFYAGSLYEWQGIRNVLDCAKFFAADKNYEFYIVGDGPMLAEVLEFIDVNDLHNISVIETLKGASFLQFISQMDVALVLRPSKLETETAFPLKIPEYIYWGIPILLTDRSAHFELSDYEKRHDLYSIVRDSCVCEDVQQLTNNLGRLKAKAQKLKESIDWSEYTWNISAEKYEAIYDRSKPH